jgi:hypothetical protein
MRPEKPFLFQVCTEAFAAIIRFRAKGFEMVIKTVKRMESSEQEKENSEEK